MLNKISLLFLAVVTSMSLVAQKDGGLPSEKLYINSSLAYLIPFTDITGSGSATNKFNHGLNFGVGYKFDEVLSLRGAWMVGRFDGYDGLRYSQSFIIEPGVYLDYDLFEKFKPGSKWKGVATFGLSWMMSSSDLFIEEPRSLITYSPTTKAGYSNAPTAAFEGTLYAPISERTFLTFGGSLRYLIANDFLDAFENGNGTDWLGSVQVGVSFDLGRTLKNGEKIMKDSEYQTIKDSQETAKNELDEQMIQFEKDLRSKDMLARQLQNDIDSLKAEMNKRILPITAEVPTAVNNSSSSEPKWRVVVGSFPNQALAQKYIDNLKVDKSEMLVLFIEQLNTYRVVYKSFDSQNAALKARSEVRGSIKDAWVVKF